VRNENFGGEIIVIPSFQFNRYGWTHYCPVRAGKRELIRPLRKANED